jgi:hypothetical protein
VVVPPATVLVAVVALQPLAQPVLVRLVEMVALAIHLAFLAHRLFMLAVAAVAVSPPVAEVLEQAVLAAAEMAVIRVLLQLQTRAVAAVAELMRLPIPLAVQVAPASSFFVTQCRVRL